MQWCDALPARCVQRTRVFVSVISNMKLLLPLTLFLHTANSLVMAQSTAPDQSSSESLIELATQRLLELQAEDGAWPYEGVYRVRRRIPYGYRVGGTAIVCTSLLYARNSEASMTAIERGVGIMLNDLAHPLMRAETANQYDVRVWGHIYALDLFCRLRLTDRFSQLREQTDPWIPKLVQILLTEQIADGGWNYAGQTRHASFVTAPAVQALLLARQVGEEVPDKVLSRARQALLNSRSPNGAFRYSGSSGRRPTALPGSIARSAVCESTLLLLNAGNVDQLREAVAAFYEHWDELEKRRAKSGTHEGPYNIAPYYFYYGHRYIGQAIRLLPEGERAAAVAQFREVLLRTKAADNTWNDRVFERSKAYGTAMSVLALLNDVPVPQTVTLRQAAEHRGP